MTIIHLKIADDDEFHKYIDTISNKEKLSPTPSRSQERPGTSVSQR